ncbi:putative bifunctional diguanylate cyclase/phosphodiesterase [Kineococcus glutinatus]|uniref:EAL domain-containing protein n=1 Tax=Kineococcus glutinatus TaxID=1070872 RepID=A0ABP9I8U8_9ACTN
MDDVVASALAHVACAVERPLFVVSRRLGPGGGGAAVLRWLNAAAEDLLGRDASQVLHTPLDELLVPVQGTSADLLGRERAERWGVQVHRADGTSWPVDLVASPAPSPGALHADELWWVLRAEATAGGLQRPRHAEDRFAVLARRSPVPTVLSDVGARLAHVNDAFARLLQLPAEELHGTAWLERVAAEDLPLLLDRVATALQGGEGCVDVRMRQASGHVRWVRVTLAPSAVPGQAAGFVGSVEDITERLAAEHRLAYQARHDLLTGLPNRTAVAEEVGRVLAGRTQRAAGAVRGDAVVMLLDLDDFKVVNDGLGHESGDALLVEVGHRLRAAVRDDDVVARIGGDEFVLLCHGLDGPGAAAVAAQRVLDAVSAPLDVQGVRIRPTASVGVVVLDTGHTGAEQVLREADIAMYAAKAGGKDRWAVTDDGAVASARRSLRLVADLRQALVQRSLDVVYQPVVMAGPAGRIVSLEALCRWRHPELGPVSPGVFVPLAEQNNLVPALDAHVLEVACRDLAAWRAQLGDLAPATVAVNLSAVSLTAPGLAGRIRAVVEAAGLQLSDLCLEITETAVLTDTAACREVLEELRRGGASVAVDDFGTGYSSLSYLRELPVDHLKVDRSFVKDLCSADARTARAVTSAVVALARALGLGTIAEGVETAAQAAVVAELGCDAAQGFLYSRPLTAEQVLALLASGVLLDPGTPPREPARPAPARPVPALSAAGSLPTEVLPRAAHR